MIILKKDGFYDKDWVYDEEKDKGEHVETKLDRNIFSLLSAWNNDIEIDSGHQVSLLDIIEFFEDKADLSILGAITKCNIDAFVHELYTDPQEERDIDYPEYIQISKFFEIRDYDDKLFEIDDQIDCCGMIEREEYKKENYGIGRIGISYTNWWYLKDTPIKISDIAELYDERKHQKKIKKRKFSIHILLEKYRSKQIAKRNKQYEEQGKCYREWDRFTEVPYRIKYNRKYKNEKFQCHMTVGEFLSSIFYELGWHPTPEARDGFIKDLQRKSDECKE